jgi:hypothetical protein
MAGRKVFQPATVLTAADVNNFLMDQAVMVFAGTAARGSAIGTATEGMVTYLEDLNEIDVYTGSSWEQVYPVQATVRTIGTATTATTAVAGDKNNVIYSLATAASTVVVPDLFTIGDRIDIVRDGAGTVVIAAGTGVTSWAGAGTAGSAVTFKIDQQYNAATVLKVAAGTYRVIGKIAV